VGLSDQCVHERQDAAAYAQHAAHFGAEVERFRVVHNNGLPSLSLGDDSSTLGSSPPKSQSTSQTYTDDSGERDDIAAESEELRFILFRHWSLYDSMFHSRFVAARLGVWREKGRMKLLNLLAKMGFSRIQAQELHTQMHPKLKREIKTHLLHVASDYNLEGICFPSFTRRIGYHGWMGASDVVHAMNALLIGDRTLISKLGGVWDIAWDDQPSDQEKSWYIGDKAWLSGFWRAYDALDRWDVLQSGLTYAMSLHRAVVRQASMVFERHAIRTLTTFRFIILTEGTDLLLFTQAFMMLQLALFINEALRVSSTCYHHGV
jgi:cell division control protein 45